MSTRKQELEEYVDDIQKDLAVDKRSRAVRKAQQKEWRTYNKLEPNSKMDFWCDRCQIDFLAPAYKIWIAYYNIGMWHSICCDCEQMVYRHITSKKLDPYYEKSEKIREMRSKGTKDMLRPDQYGFKTLYGDPFEEMHMKRQRREEDIYDKYAKYGIKGMTLDRKHEEETIT